MHKLPTHEIFSLRRVTSENAAQTEKKRKKKGSVNNSIIANKA